MAELRHQGKVAVITGATEGIGYAIAERLGKEGAKVVISSRKQKNVDQAVNNLRSQGIEVLGRICHVGKREHREAVIEDAVSNYGGIDILVSNAAVNPIYGRMLKVTTEGVWDKIFDVNVKASFFLIKSALPYMKNRSGASITLISSISGYSPDNLFGVYCVSKTAMLGLAKNLALELAKYGIRVNCLSPGLIKTQLSKQLWDGRGETYIKSNIPLRKYGLPEDCGKVVSFLASKDAAFITGESIVASGGQVSRL
ncbi:Dehydrogenase/reductase SDR family member 4 [Trichoplax sp. H2]|nr:Dehydrogenase/reductase SDR family member 4 [Trichoplax sp. H2]|eukprot:RDD39477.1 Dehydrogenase/reductase SDR family member 4 [Trichoplax sp. H2]